MVSGFFCISASRQNASFNVHFSFPYLRCDKRPFVGFVWALYDFALLAGDRRFVQHWAYWQDWIDMFNENNPSGQVPSGYAYNLVLWLAMFVTFVSSVKRLVVGLFLGRQTFLHYSEELAEVMGKMVLISEIATLARLPLPQGTEKFFDDRGTWNQRDVTRLIAEEDRSAHSSFTPDKTIELPQLHGAHGEAIGSGTVPAKIISDTNGIDTDQDRSGEIRDTQEHQPPLAKESEKLQADAQSSGGTMYSKYTETERQLIYDLLEQWEEPDRVNRQMVGGAESRTSLFV